MRLGFLGMENVVSVRVLEALVHAEHDVRFVLKPVGGLVGRTQPLFEAARPVATDRERRAFDPFVLAAQRNIRCHVVGDAGRDTVAKFVARHELDLVVICFFNQLVPAAVFDAARLGSINVHPSLLPNYRGPSPLFWTFKNGDPTGGVTVHQVTAGEDAGDIWDQRSLRVPLGATLSELLDLIGNLAGAMVPQVVAALGEGVATPRVQGTPSTRRARRPRAEDRIVGGPMSARATYCLARGMGRVQDLRVYGNEKLRVLDGLGFEEGKEVPGDNARVGDTVYIRCADGRALVRLATRG